MIIGREFIVEHRGLVAHQRNSGNAHAGIEEQHFELLLVLLHAGLSSQASFRTADDVVLIADRVKGKKQGGIEGGCIVIVTALLIIKITGDFFFIAHGMAAILVTQLAGSAEQRGFGTAFFIHHADIIDRRKLKHAQVLESLVKTGIFFHALDESAHICAGADDDFR